MSAPSRDLPARYLDAVARLFPATRRDWGAAMQAELATLTRPSERWRFALGCTRAALLPSREARVAWLPFAVAITAAVVAIGEYALATAIGQTVPLLLVLALLAWRGRRPGYFGPVRPDRTARVVRASGYALIGFYLVALIAADGGGLLQPTQANWGPVFAIMLTLLAALFLALTARGTRFGSIGLGAGSIAGVVAGVATFAVMPFEHGETSLAHGLPWNGQWLWLIVLAAPTGAALFTGKRSRRADHGAMAATLAVTFGVLLVALLGFAAILLFRGSLEAPPLMPGASAADKLAEQEIGASDGYGGMLTFGFMLAAILWVMLRPVRARTTFVLLALLAVPPAALGFAVRESALWGTVLTFAAAGLTLAAASSILAATGVTRRSDAAGATP
jgi:hypothetical protein